MSVGDEMARLSRRAASGDLESARRLVRAIEAGRGQSVGRIPHDRIVAAASTGDPVVGHVALLIDELLGRHAVSIDEFVSWLAEDLLASGSTGVSWDGLPAWRPVGVDDGKVVLEVTGKIDPGTVLECMLIEAKKAALAEHARWRGREASTRMLVLESPGEDISHETWFVSPVRVWIDHEGGKAFLDGDILRVAWPVRLVAQIDPLDVDDAWREDVPERVMDAIRSGKFRTDEGGAWRAYLCADRSLHARGAVDQHVGWDRGRAPGPMVPPPTQS